MKSMSGVNRLPKEHCKCLSCEEEFSSEDDVRHTWKCPVCGEFLHIYAEDETTNTRIVLIRKTASEVDIGDLIHLPGGLTEDCYMVLAINKLDNHRLGIALKGYGTHKVSRDTPINCREGAW